jgi:hypothetical protein
MVGTKLGQVSRAEKRSFDPMPRRDERIFSFSVR